MPKIPLVFLPGLLCDERLWREQARSLADVADPAIADLTRDDTISGIASRVLTAAPPSFALAGLSMGGYVAFEILRQAPERVSRLALLATSAGPDSLERQALRRAGIESLKFGRFAGVTQRLLPRLVHPRHVSSPVGDEVRAMAERVGGEVYLGQQTAILGRQDSRPLLRHIAVPTLVAAGDSDLLTPPVESEEIHRGIPGSTLHLLKDCGHLPALEQPEETTRLLRDWLNY